METINVLLVEDNPDDAYLVCDAVEEYCQGTAANVVWLTTLEDALKYVNDGAQKDLTVVILDLGLPDNFGIHTYQVARANIDPLIPIIIVSGMDDRELALHALLEGARNYIVKGPENYGPRVARAIMELRRGTTKPPIGLTLYISSNETAKMASAIRTMRKLLEAHPNLNLSIIDIETHPSLSETAKIFHTPSLVVETESGREMYTGLLDEPESQDIMTWITKSLG